MTKLSFSFLGKAVIIFVTILVIITIGGNIIIHYYPSSSGYYSYSVKISGLSDYSGSPVTQIVVPIPSIGNESIFADERFQYQDYGGWKSFLVDTEHGKMLTFQSNDANLADINAVYTKETDEYPDTEEINEDIFVPAGRSLLRTDNTTAGYSYIILPDDLRPLSNSSTPISVSIKLTVHGGTKFGKPDLDRECQIAIEEQITPGTTGIIPVEPQVYYRDSISEGFRPPEYRDKY
ncbi:hypothetical protein Mpet_0876 [Methanolacinia petrolearia DSM 11571]|uniref:Uncharacterized protein n=1 Tax=Methanolacinia petrolearia (strain DSM 11571 / OCM 486 / SEBR 4847) TaxID=679926 RepID=E1RJC7_METP4|nr:hypothetical protein [Methanolacinia petrolearia]ADN35645.1 hypothetical protein Mpet_0876 [Methanolacinia petrolearia DSM 11571]